jgi:dipeptide/tripeptide permease
MLQRMQSIWLLLAAVFAFLTIKLSFYSGNIGTPEQPPSFQYLTAGFNIWILILTIALVCIATIDIFLYKNRKLQGRLAILGILLSLLNIFLYYKQTQKFIQDQGTYNLTAILALLIPVFFFLSWRGIYRDQKLIKSLDRLR